MSSDKKEVLEKKEHQECIDSIKSKLVSMGFGTRPPHLFHHVLYHPDLCVSIDGNFIVVEFINTNYPGDVMGQQTLCLNNKNRIEAAVCIVSDSLYSLDPEKLASVKDYVEKWNKYCGTNVVLLRENEYESWFRVRIERSTAWKPSELEVR